MTLDLSLKRIALAVMYFGPPVVVLAVGALA